VSRVPRNQSSALGARAIPPAQPLSHAVAIIAIAIAITAAYANSFSVPFLYDDEINIAKNPYIRVTELSALQLRRAVVQDAFQLRPLSNASFALDFYVHRLNRTVMHAENLALHLATAIVLYFLALELIGLLWWRGHPHPRHNSFAAAIASLVWALHPAQVQAVSYLVQRQTLMATLGIIGSLLFYLRGRARPEHRVPAFIAAGLFFLMGAGSKETGLVAPALWIAAELTLLLRPETPRPSRRALIFGGAALALGALALAAALVKSGILARYFAGYASMSYGPGGRLLTEARVLCSYLVTMIFPHPARLALDHEVLASTALWRPWTTIPAVLVLALLAAALLPPLLRCERGESRFPPALPAFLAAGFIVAALPESSVMPLDLMVDHRIYLYSLFVLPPLAAIAVLAVPPRLAVPIAAVALILSGIMTAGRNQVFSSPRTVWREAVTAAPGRARPWANYCSALIEQQALAPALAACERAAALEPGEALPQVNRGVALMGLGRDEEAGRIFQAVADAHPESALAQYNQAAACELNGERDRAIGYYERALVADQFHFEARLRLARLLVQADREREALATIEFLPQLYPESARAWLELARVRIAAGDWEGAAQALREARNQRHDQRLEDELRAADEELRRRRGGP
jgi:protein O-mannosyl-transferase